MGKVRIHHFKNIFEIFKKTVSLPGASKPLVNRLKRVFHSLTVIPVAVGITQLWECIQGFGVVLSFEASVFCDRPF